MGLRAVVTGGFSRHARTLSAVVVALVMLFSSASPAAAHGVEVTALLIGDGDVEVGEAAVGFTDETGETCVEMLAPVGTFSVFIHKSGIPEGELVSLFQVVGGEEFCVLADVDVVESILADVNAHSLSVERSDGTFVGVGVLKKPLPPGFDQDGSEGAPTVRFDGGSGNDSTAGGTLRRDLVLRIAGPIAIALIGGLGVSRLNRRRVTSEAPS